MTKDQELIEQVKQAHKAKDLADLCKKIDMSHVTLTKWNTTGKIPDNGTGRQYLKLLLENKKKDAELELYRNLGNTLTAIQNYQKDNQE